MLFERLLDLSNSQEKLAQRMEQLGTPREKALEAACQTSVGDLSQVSKDLVRVPHMDVILDSKPVGSPDRYVDVNDIDFSNVASVENFVTLLGSNNPYLNSYLGAYLHQGGFQNTAETLLSYFFRFEANPDEQILINTENRKNRFIIHQDGSLTFEECFDIDEIKLTDESIYKPEGGRIASVKLRSKISVVENENGEKEVVHSYEDIEVKAHDKAAKKLFSDPRNPFAKFIDWAKNLVKLIFSQTAREQNQRLNHIPRPGMKL